ncbi:GTPase [Escherichia coli]
MNPIAVTLLTGFLGAGKTTLLRHILNEQHGYKIAVIENEFGEVSVDDQLIGDRATQIKTLTNGCICCSRSNELEDALLDLLDNLDKGYIQFDRLVIECTGMADPGPIIQTFFSHEVLCQRYLLDGVIALVDAVHADEQMNQFTIAQSQVGYADRILLTKTDVAGEAEKLRERLARINARAPVYTVTHGDIDLGLAVQHQRFYAGRKRRQHQATFSLYRGQTKRYFVDCGGTGLPGRYQRSFPGDGKPAAGIGG